MVLLRVKRGDENQFLYETPINTPVDTALAEIVSIFNGRLKISRICAEMEELAKHGVMFPPEILGLNEDQVRDFKLVDPWADKCIPSGGYIENKDPMGRRNGRQPHKHLQDMISKTIEDVKAMTSRKLVDQNEQVTIKTIHEAIKLLKGAITIVYPMNLPPHDPIRLEFENIEDLTGTQASLDVLDPATAQLWFSGKEMVRGFGKLISEYAGRNDKCKLVVKLQKKGEGPPGREPVMTETERKNLMVYAYRKQEEAKKLEQNDDDEYLNASWADSSSLKRQFHGLKNISWRPK
ncbi:cilia- and flagella-associated protein 298 [Ctenocephalides felis]|uniref:cilia- and flagella-associated protein 298 n=1 Tax=Ctenocephalides felis TaxID=7515 RepID=UPI000E6E2DC3|nr:cilia- and flagella-associated protein 298 [Ctenocephalides felis]